MRLPSTPSAGRGRGERRRISWTVGAVVLGVLLLVGMGLLGLSRMKGDLDRLAGHNLVAITAAADLSTAVSAVREGALSQLSTTDPYAADRIGADLDRTAIPRLRLTVRTLRLLTVDEPASGPSLDQIQADLDRYQRLRSAIDRRGPTGATPSPTALTGLSRLAIPLFDRMRAETAAVRAGETIAAEGSLREAVATYDSTRSLLRTGGAASLLVGLVVMLLTVRRTDAARRRAADQVEFVDTLQVTASEDEAHELVQRYLERSLPGSAAVVLKRNNSENHLEAATALVPGSVVAARLPGSEPRSCLALRFGRTHREDPHRLPLLSCVLCADPGARSTCEPLLVGGQVIGSVLVGHSAPLDAEEEARIKSSVAQAAPVLANLRNLALAEFRANNDSLTGLPNKRATDDTLKRMVAQANRSIMPLAAAMLDLDHFKQVNDRFGHSKGDEVLAAVGAAVRSCLRAGDFAGRFGGEELLVLLPDTSSTDAFIVAERLRTAIATVTVVGVERAITVSIGIADLIQPGGNATGLLRQADRALYAAKAAGRNRTVAAIGDAPVLGDAAVLGDLPEPAGEYDGPVRHPGPDRGPGGTGTATAPEHADGPGNAEALAAADAPHDAPENGSAGVPPPVNAGSARRHG